MVDTKKKIIALAATGALVAAVGLTACSNSGTASSTSSSNSSNTTASTSSNASSSANANANANASANANTASSSSSTAKTAEVVAWKGALTDGAIVTYVANDDGTKAALSIEPANGEKAKVWTGDMTTAADGTITITDDTSKEAVKFILAGMTGDGVALIDMSPDGYGKGALVPLTAKDVQDLAEAEAAAQLLGTYVSSLGMFEDGSLIYYTESADGNQGVVAVLPKDTKTLKMWAGKATTAADGTETVTDDKTGETFNYTMTENAQDGTMDIEAPGYGKGKAVKMTVGDWLVIDELAKALSK